MAVKNGADNGILFKNRKGVEYVFDNLTRPTNPSGKLNVFYSTVLT
jgi:hypothetical protein